MPIEPASPTSPTKDSMMSSSHAFVRMYSRLNDGEHVAILTVHPEGNALRYFVVNRDTTVYELTLSEQQVARYKNMSPQTEGLGWPAFFELMQKAFVDHLLDFTPEKRELKITLKHERQTESVPVSAFSASFTLQLAKATDVTCGDIVKNMIAFLGLRAGDRREQDRIHDLARDAAELWEESVMVEEERQLLDNNVSFLERDIQRLEAESAELERQLQQCDDAKIAGGWKEALEAASLWRVTTRVWNPVRGARNECPPSEFNQKLLRAIKGKWVKRLPELIAAPGETSGPGTGGSRTMSLSVTSDGSAGSPRRAMSMALLRGSDAVSDAGDTELTQNERRTFDMLDKVDHWEFSASDFDAKARSTAFSKGALFYLGYLAFQRFGLFTAFNLSERKLLDWLAVIEAGHREQAHYHSAQHAAMTLHSVMYILLNGQFLTITKGLPDVAVLSLVVASIICCYDHPGVSNRYLCDANSYIALMYGKQSVLQNHHVSSALELLKEQRYDFLDAFSPAKRAEVFTLVHTLVLSTDLDRHDQFMQYIAARGDALAGENTVPASQLLSGGGATAKERQATITEFNTTAPDTFVDDPVALMCLVFRCGEVAYATKNSYQYQQRADALYKEMRNDAAMEQGQHGGGPGSQQTPRDSPHHHSTDSPFQSTTSGGGNPPGHSPMGPSMSPLPAVVSPLSGPQPPLLPNAVVQHNLLSYVVQPLFSVLGDVCPLMRFIGDDLGSNRELYRV